jgi:hypothetical protein
VVKQICWSADDVIIAQSFRMMPTVLGHTTQPWNTLDRGSVRRSCPMQAANVGLTTARRHIRIVRFATPMTAPIAPADLGTFEDAQVRREERNKDEDNYGCRRKVERKTQCRCGGTVARTPGDIEKSRRDELIR